MNALKSTIIFAGGVLIGVAASKVYFEDKYKKKADEEIESVKEYYRKKTMSIKPDLKVLDGAAVTLSKDGLTPEELEKAKAVADDIMSKYSYSNISKKKTDSVEKKTEEVSNIFDKEQKLAESEHPLDSVDRNDSAPYSVEAIDFANNEHFYDQSSLTYYTEDESLVNESEELVDVDFLIGEENLKIFAESDDDEMYIRNDRLGIDFEIIKINGSYAEEIGMNTD